MAIESDAHSLIGACDSRVMIGQIDESMTAACRFGSSARAFSEGSAMLSYCVIIEVHGRKI